MIWPAFPKNQIFHTQNPADPPYSLKGKLIWQSLNILWNTIFWLWWWKMICMLQTVTTRFFSHRSIPYYGLKWKYLMHHVCHIKCSNLCWNTSESSRASIGSRFFFLAFRPNRMTNQQLYQKTETTGWQRLVALTTGQGKRKAISWNALCIHGRNGLLHITHSSKRSILKYTRSNT